LGRPVLELPAEPTINLFDEMDLIADRLRANPLHVEADDQICISRNSIGQLVPG
jgi:hypothetical protein